MRLSACLVARDDAATLGRCLDSLSEVADELVVVDRGSTDDTVAIAEERGARVIPFEPGDLVGARNASLAQATGDMVLHVEADETLHPDDRDALRATLRTADPGPRRVCLVRPLDPHTAEVTRRVRLFPADPELRFLHPVHAEIQRPSHDLSPRDADLRLLQLEDAREERRRDALQMTLSVLKREPDNPTYLYYAGVHNLALGEIETGISWLERARRLSADADRPVALNALSAAAFERDQYAHAERLGRQSVRLVPEQHRGWTLLGELLLLAQRHEAAIEVLRSGLAVDHSRLWTDVLPHRAKLRMHLGMCHVLTHAPREAVSDLTAALAAETLSEEDRRTAERYRAMAMRMATA